MLLVRRPNLPKRARVIALPRSSRAKARTHAVCNAKRPPKGRPFLWCQSPHSCLIHPPGTALSPAGFRI
jgi:hypothetical protein